MMVDVLYNWYSTIKVSLTFSITTSPVNDSVKVCGCSALAGMERRALQATADQRDNRSLLSCLLSVLEATASMLSVPSVAYLHWCSMDGDSDSVSSVELVLNHLAIMFATLNLDMPCFDFQKNIIS